jgi:hypothetical protein
MSLTSKSKTKPAISKQVEVEDSATPSFWQFLTLKFQGPKSPVWYDLEGNPFEEVPSGQLLGLDIQARDFDGKLDYRLLCCLCDGKNFFLLAMGATTFSALSLVEPLCLLPNSILRSEIAIHHQLELKTPNPYIRLVVEVEGRFLNSPLSSLPFWRKYAFKRIAQLQQKLGQPSLQLEVLEDEEF